MTLLTRKKANINRIDKISRGKCPESWWAKAAQPEQREQFISEAQQRHEQRTHETNLREVRALYTQGTMHHRRVKP